MYLKLTYRHSKDEIYSDIVEVSEDSTLEELDVIYLNWLLGKIGHRGSWELLTNSC